MHIAILIEEAETVTVQKVPLAPLHIIEVHGCIRVLPIANDWMSDVHHMCPDLVASPRADSDRDKAEVFGFAAAVCDHLQPSERRFPFATDNAWEIPFVVPEIDKLIDFLTA